MPRLSLSGFCSKRGLEQTFGTTKETVDLHNLISQVFASRLNYAYLTHHSTKGRRLSHSLAGECTDRGSKCSRHQHEMRGWACFSLSAGTIRGVRQSPQVHRPSKPYEARWKSWIIGLITKDPNLVDIHVHSDGVDIIPRHDVIPRRFDPVHGGFV